jgi:hypothetical protein
MYVKHNTQERSYNHYYSRKEMSIMHAECASVILVTQHAMRMRHTVICGLSGSTIFFQITS